MEPEKIVGIVEMYEKRLKEAGIPKKRMDPARTFADLSKDEILMHARSLCKNTKSLVQFPEHKDKGMRHFSALQMCLSFAGWYTLSELMEHNH